MSYPFEIYGVIKLVSPIRYYMSSSILSSLLFVRIFPINNDEVLNVAPQKVLAPMSIPYTISNVTYTKENFSYVLKRRLPFAFV